MCLFLARMRGEFLLDRFRRKSRRRNRMLRVTQRADDLGCQHRLQDLAGSRSFS
jgi:hypothetical protein